MINDFFTDLKNIQGLKQQRSKGYAKAMSMSKETYNDITIRIQKIIKTKYPYLKGSNLTHNHILSIMSDLIIENYEVNKK